MAKNKYEAEIDLNERNTSQTLAVEFTGYDKRVLEVGPASGYVTKVLKNRGCSVTGIELDPDTAKQAERYCEKVIVGDIESLDLDQELEKGSFDVVMFGDVLEHLKDPLKTLQRVKTLLQPEGYLVASIPNIAHGSVRLALLQGKFQYRPLGLLDGTHLRFFTRESIEQLFNDAGFFIGELERVKLGVLNTEVEVDRELVTEEMMELVESDPESETYQFVLTAHPSTYAGEFTNLSNHARLLSEYLDRRDRTIYELKRKLRNAEELQRQLDRRDKQLERKEKRISELSGDLAERNRTLLKNERTIRRLNDQIEQMRKSNK